MAEKEASKKTAEEVAWTEHYERLMAALPIVKLLPKFISKRIITFSEQDRILAGEIESDKRARFLKHITNHLTTGNTHSFYKFLDVVETHGGSYSYLATDIKKTLEQYQQDEKEGENDVPYPTEETFGDDDKVVPSLPYPTEEISDDDDKILDSRAPRETVTPANEIPQGGNLMSINEEAEATSMVTVTEERLGEERKNVTKKKKYLGSSHPKLADLVEHVGSFVSPKWFNLGLRLGVDSHILDRIESDERDCSNACRKMFQAWLKNNSGRTWNDVMVALRSNSVGASGVADKLEEMIATS